MKSRALIAMAAPLILCLMLTSARAQDSKSAASADPQPAAAQDSSQKGSAEQPASDPAKTKSDAKAKDKDKDEDKEEKQGSGGKDDVDAIGNRKMGGRGMGNWYSIESEIRLGKQYAQEIESTIKLVQDPVVNEYVNRVGQNIVRNSDAKVPFTIKVIDSDEINAMALPGGFFYVNSGLILAADEEAELAGVMAHEIAHVAARHAMRQMTRGNLAQIASIPLIFVGGWAGYGAYQAANVGIPTAFMKFSRSFEAEADYLGVQYMYKAGYDPHAFISFFEKIQTKEKKKPGTLAKVFSDHPQTPDRIDKSKEEIEKILPPRDQYIVSTSEFDDVKARLAAIENRRKVVDEKDSSAPSLRRSNQDKKKSGDGKDEDDRPTLKRREGDQ